MALRFTLPNQQPVNSAGVPYAGGFLYFYLSGTSTPTNTYSNAGLTIPNSNPVVLSSDGGTGNIFLAAGVTYKVVLKDVLGNTIWTYDPVSDSGAGSKTLYGLHSDIAAASIGPALTAVESAGYSTLTDGGGGMYVNISAPIVTKRWQFQDASGQWRQLAENEFYPEMLGAKGDGITNDAAVFLDLMTIDVNGAGRRILLTPGKSYIIDGTELLMQPRTEIIGYGASMVATGTSGGFAVPLLHCAIANANNISLRGGIYQGIGSSTKFEASGTTTNGLVWFERLSVGSTTGSNVTVRDVEIKSAWNLFSITGIDRAFVSHCYVHDFMVFGVLLSACPRWNASDNYIYDSANTNTSGGKPQNSYGIHATGDNGGAAPIPIVSGIACRNYIANIPKWDGIGSEGAGSLILCDNYMTNVRQGIDVSIGDVTPITYVVATGNTIIGPSTDPFGGSAASCGGIQVIGTDTNPTHEAIISKNIIKGFYNPATTTLTASSSAIVVQSVNRAVVSDNIIAENGTHGAKCGIVIGPGTSSWVTLDNNIIEGTFPDGAIRGNGNTGTVTSITNNIMTQATVSDPGIYLSNATLGAVVAQGNVSNSTAKISINAGTTYTSWDGENTTAASYTAGSSTVDLYYSHGYAVIANAGATNITNIANGWPGHTVKLKFSDANTSLVNGASTFHLAGGAFTGANNATITLFSLGGNVWEELCRSANT